MRRSHDVDRGRQSCETTAQSGPAVRPRSSGGRGAGGAGLTLSNRGDTFSLAIAVNAQEGP